MVYEGMQSENKIKLVINGVTIPKLSDYSYFDAKSFFTEPKRSAKGVIENLNSYATFLTPRLKFSFKLMPVETYRTLMKLIKEFNEFIVTVYDIVEDSYATHKMYFYPKDFPQIYQNSLEVLAIREESFEMVGTNAKLEELSVVYNSNPPVEGETTLTTGLTINYNSEFVVGSYDPIDGAIDPTTFAYNGYTLDKWTENADGSGLAYFNGDIVETFSSSKILYAQWKSNNQFSLSFDYQCATSGNTESTRQVTQYNPIGELPQPVKNGYVFSGWFTMQDGKGTPITSADTYTFNTNKTVYAFWVGVQNTISFDANGGKGTMENIIARTGDSVTLPLSGFNKDNLVFSSWNTQADGKGTTYGNGATIVMPDGNLQLFAIYVQGYTLTYDLNGGVDANGLDKPKEFGVRFLNPPYVTKTGYAISGWYADNTFTSAVKFPLTIEKDTTIYAKWEEIAND